MRKSLIILMIIYLANISYAEIVFKKHIIGENQEKTMCVISFDIDKDGDKDILSSSYNKNGIIWWENNGKQNFIKHIIAKDYGNVRTAYAIDIDKDGDIDILATSYSFTPDPNSDKDKLGRLAWFENDGKQNFVTHVITDEFPGAHTISASDLDNDGDIDLMGAAFTLEKTGKLSWFENDGKQNFKEHVLSNRASTCVYGADINEDGQMDVLGAMYMNNEILWWQNNGDKTFTKKIISKSFRLPHWARAVDLDKDGDVDIIGAACGKSVSWWKNDGKENFIEHKITSNFACASSIYSADIDNDGDMDVFSTSENFHDIRWWENNGKQSFTEHTVSGLFPGASDVYIDDVDGDGDLDILGAGNIENQISWWENKGKKLLSTNDIRTEAQFFTFIRTEGTLKALELYKNKKNKIEFREKYMNNLAYEFFRAKKKDDCLNLLKLNVETFPNSANTYLALAEIYQVLKMKQSDEYYNKAKKMPLTTESFRKRLNLSLLKKDKNEYTKLLKDLKKNNKTKYKLQENVLNFLGYQLMMRKLVVEAILVFKTNTELFSKSFNVFDSLGEVYMKNGQNKLAIENYKKSLELNPKNKNADNMLKKIRLKE